MTRTWSVAGRPELGLLHGFAASAFTWRALLPFLPDIVHPVPLGRPWGSLSSQVDFTLLELDRHRLARPVLVGHSAGAEVAVAVAIRAPGRVRGLVLVAPVIGRRAPVLARAAASVPGSQLLGPMMLRASTRFLGPVLRGMRHDPTPVTGDVVEGYRRALVEPGVAEALWDMTRRDDDRDWVLEGAAKLELPCLVVVGASDRWATPVPVVGARHVAIERCGHLPHEEHTGLVAADIVDFIDGLGGRQLG